MIHIFEGGVAMVWWSFVLGIVGGILLFGAFSLFACKRIGKCEAQEALSEVIDWMQENSKSTDESNQD